MAVATPFRERNIVIRRAQRERGSRPTSLRRQLLLFAALLVAFSVIRFPYERLVEQQLSDLKRLASQRGIIFDIENPKIRFPGRGTFDKISLFFAVPNWIIPIPVSIDRGNISLDLLSIVLLRAGISGRGQAYEGEIAFQSSKPFFSSNVSSDIQLDSVQLRAHPLLRPYQATGSLSAALNSRFSDDAKLSALSGSLELRDAAVTIQEPIAGILRVPPISDGNIEASVALEDGRIAISNCAGSTSIGSFRCTASFGLKGTTIADGLVSFDLALEEEARKAFGPYLAMGAGKPDLSNRGAWKINLEIKSGTISHFKVNPA